MCPLRLLEGDERYLSALGRAVLSTSLPCVCHKPLMASLKKLVIRPDPDSQGEQEAIADEHKEDKEEENEEEVCHWCCWVTLTLIAVVMKWCLEL